MGKGRLEAFSDGVIAIIITIMVLELRPPMGFILNSLKPVFPAFIAYILSFVNVALYWNNHHHMMFTVQHVNGKVLWANTHLLFWLSLVPFTTDWMGEHPLEKWPVALYGIVLMMAGAAYYILAHTLIKIHGENSILAKALGKDRKGIISVVIYMIAVLCAFFYPGISLIMYALVAAIWLIPDRRIEKRIREE